MYTENKRKERTKNMKKERIWWFGIDVVTQDITHVYAETEEEAFKKAHEYFMKEKDFPFIDDEVHGEYSFDTLTCLESHEED